MSTAQQPTPLGPLDLLAPHPALPDDSLVSPLYLTAPVSPESSPVKPEFLEQALMLLENQRLSSEALKEHDRSVFSSPGDSLAPTPVFSSPSLSASSHSDYFCYTMTPLTEAGPSTRPSLGDRRASSSSSRLGWHTPPLSIALPPRPQFNEKGEELEDVPSSTQKRPVEEAMDFSFHLEPLKLTDSVTTSIEEAQARTELRAKTMRRVKSQRALDSQLGFELNG